MKSQSSNIEGTYTAKGIHTGYQITVWHEGLPKNRKIKADTRDLLSRMADAQMRDWDKQWAAKQAQDATKSAQLNAKNTALTKKNYATERTQNANEETAQLARTLRHTLGVNDAVDWGKLKDSTRFTEPKPQPSMPPAFPVQRNYGKEPIVSDPVFQPQIGFFDRVLKKAEGKQAHADAQFRQAHDQWSQAKDAAQRDHSEAIAQHTLLTNDLKSKDEKLLQEWQSRKDAFVAEQKQKNDAVDAAKAAYHAGDPNEIVSYCDLVLSFSQYPDFMPNSWEIDYNAEGRVLLLDYSLPEPDKLPTLVEVKYVAARDEFTEKQMTPVQAAKQYDDFVYQVVLRTVHELFEADVIDALDTIVFNGFVRSIDKSTGNEVNACILSLQARKAEFLAINLANVDPKACFKQLKGVGSSKMHSITAVAPIMQMRREDGRFVNSYDVANHLDEGFNLAAMDWEDFEHLIRELFAQEFAEGGGEVRVTQASRDGGVDAVIFDPDPIRGGKIIIQAKRYTATVGVAAVRDLYGTVQHEGAMKGILVTTSDYGPDAYAFVKDKPLVLLSGANLLHLLEKHGHRAKIDLQEARQIALSQKVQ